VAKRPFFVWIGPSNTNGQGSTLADYPGTDLARIIGLPAFPSTTPAQVTVPGIKMWQAKKPFAVSTSLQITDVPATNQLESEGFVSVASNVGQWVYVSSNTTGQGNLRPIAARAGNLITVNTPWSPTLSADGTVRLITGSRTIGGVALSLAGGPGVADAGGTTTTMVDAARVEVDDFWNGYVIRFTSGANSGLTRVITDFVDATNQIVFSPAVTANVGAGDTYEIFQSGTIISAGIADALGSTSTMVDAARTEVDDYWNGATIRFTSGANINQTREIIDFFDTTNTVVFSPAVTAAVGAGDTYDIIYSTKAIPKDPTSPVFTGADVGRWVKFTSGEYRKIASITADGAWIKLDNALLALPAALSAIYVLDGAATADTLTNFAQGAAFNDLQFYLDVAPVYFTGFDYSNYRQFTDAAPTSTAAFTLVNVVPEGMTQLRYRFQDTIYGFCIGVDGAQAAPEYIGTSLQFAYFSWLHDVTHLDYHPSNATGIMGAVLTGIASAQALAIAAGDTLDPQGIFLVGLLENDTLDVQKLAHLGENVKLIIDKVRTALGSQRVPVVITGCSPSSILLPNHDEDADRVSANAQALQLKLDDPWIGFVPTPNSAFIKHSDGIHYLAPGTIAIAQAVVEEWDAVVARASSASKLVAELPTLSSLRTRVKRRYERSAIGNDASSTQVDIFINDSIREIHNTLGDTAWFLRRVEEVDISATFPTVITLPRTVKRLLRLEVASCPGRPLSWKGISYTDQGRTQITLFTVQTGPFLVHYIANTPELVVDTDYTLIPADHTELVVMLTCKRLTECAGNLTMAQYYSAESERLWRTLKKENLRYDRMRQESMDPVGGYDSTRNSPFLGGDEWGL
jgi:hypothetical protein